MQLIPLSALGRKKSLQCQDSDRLQGEQLLTVSTPPPANGVLQGPMVYSANPSSSHSSNAKAALVRFFAVERCLLQIQQLHCKTEKSVLLQIFLFIYIYKYNKCKYYICVYIYELFFGERLDSVCRRHKQIKDVGRGSRHRFTKVEICL